MKIYTKSGDAGMTSIIGGQRLAKSALVVLELMEVWMKSTLG